MSLCIARISSNFIGVARGKMRVTVLDRRWGLSPLVRLLPHQVLIITATLLENDRYSDTVYFEPPPPPLTLYEAMIP